MFKSLQIEWMKIKNYRVFQVFSILYLIGIVVIIYIVYKVYMQLTARVMALNNPNSSRDGEDLFRLFSKDSIWRTTTFFTGLLLYLPGMIIISLFVNEVNFKTHRQNIIDGWKRETFIYTKIGLIFCISIVVTIMNIIATYVMCQVTNTEFSLVAGLDMLGYSFIQNLVYLLFALLLAILFRRSGVAIIVFFIYGLLIEFLLLLLFNYLVPGMGHFLPLQVADSMLAFPGMDGPAFGHNPGVRVLLPVSLLYIAIYAFFAIRKYKYDDL